MRGMIDFSSWQGVMTTLLGLVVITAIGVGIRLLVMHGVQQRRERANRQINERLKTLIAAYKTLGGSFTGDLAVDPSHRRHQREAASSGTDPSAAQGDDRPGAERRRRTRDAVEAALSDVILLGTESQVRLAVRAADDMIGGRPVETAELVASLRQFIREVLDLDPIPPGLAIPKQGPLRVATATRGAPRGDRPAGGGKVGGQGGGQGGDAGGVGLGGAGYALGRGDHGDGSASTAHLSD